MSELEIYQMEQLAEKVAELEKMNQLIPFGIIAFLGVIFLTVFIFIFWKSKE